MILVTDETVAYKDVYCFEQGILVEYTVVPEMQLLAAASRVQPTWGIEADQYRHHVVLWDSIGVFPRLWEAARHLPAEAFAEVEHDAWWRAYEAYEGYCKFRSAVRSGEPPRVHYAAWQFAYTTALRIALRERRPLESRRTIWKDMASRGYGMDELLAALTAGDTDRISARIERSWEETRSWGQPESAA